MAYTHTYRFTPNTTIAHITARASHITVSELLTLR